MKTVRTFALKTQQAMVIAFLVVFSLGASVSHWARSRSQDALLISIQEELANAAKLPRLKPRQRTLEELERMRQDIPELLQASEARSRREFCLALLAGLAASAAFAFALSRYIIEPIASLASYAAAWRPGEPWTCSAPVVSPEITGLYARIAALVGHLNDEYRKQRDLNQLKSQFVALVSHELNNALSVIHAASFNLEESDPDPFNEKRQKMYRMILRQTRALSAAVGNLLNAGRLESGKLSLRKKKMEMAAVLKSSLELLEPLHEEKRLKVSLTLPGTPTTVYADPDALTLVATNLMSNAIKYTPAGGSISVGIAHEGAGGRFVRVYVKDTGIGIPPGDRERIFSGFYRSKAAQKLEKGFGIGLSLAKSIVEAHGGRLELESIPGRGSTFSFLLPLWAEGPDQTEGKRVDGPRSLASA